MTGTVEFRGEAAVAETGVPEPDDEPRDGGVGGDSQPAVRRGALKPAVAYRIVLQANVRSWAKAARGLAPR